VNKTESYSSEDRLATGWIAKMAAGQADSLNALYRLYHRPLLTIFNGILRDREAAEEVLQDTFVKAFHNAAGFNPAKGTPFAWLATIGRRLSIDRIRSKRARPDQGNLEHLEKIADHISEGTEKNVYRKTEYYWLHETMDKLPDRQQRIIRMAFLEGYTHHEIAELTGFPLGTVKSEIFRGLNTLRENHFGNND